MSRLSRIVFGGAALLLVALVSFSAMTQTSGSSCDDPFGGERVSFRTGEWELTDFCMRSVEFSEILWGGVPRDGIPPIDDPQFESIEAANEWLLPQSPVLSVEIDGDARAYPLAILTRHEIVNDQFGDLPVAVTYCPLCNSALVYEREIDGVTLRFGVSGNLRNSDLIMWDDATQSWWQQLTGEAIVGTYTGTRLVGRPAQVVGYGAFVEQYPQGMVLSRNGRSYGSNPYVGYEGSNPQDFLFRGELDERLHPTARVLAGIVDSVAVAYSFETLAEMRVINDVVGEVPVVAFWQPGATSALDRSVIDESVDVGMAGLFRREVDGQTLTFVVDEAGVIRDEQTNSVWNVFGTAIEGELAGTELFAELAASHFWFAWFAFMPETLLYEGEDS